ncbi:hypothetical protein DLAC_03921 [Tieghemostelium lacteum]|uniref:HEAT repeat-containing protein n=1 Tax=Tieghemostelium lacteum TaxID=361077 RepID=A0A152A171_TIELA|nr:hypothetical protein DLAC_03921 [Tieghemostelium lacteum]|eukprot:KYQ99953.1 hypothetical protein DLAC_03921 [Tieghemostelium lacteum]
MTTSIIIIDSIQESFVQYFDKLEKETVSYLEGLILESESEDEMKEQITNACSDFEIIQDASETAKVVEHLVSILRKKGVLQFQSSAKPKAKHLVCELIPKELKLSDPNLTMDQYLELTRHSNPAIRIQVLRTMCPCKVKDDIDQLWTRIMEMSSDPDPRVRYQVIHDLCDGSPNWREDQVIKTLESMHNDPDAKVRRTINNVLTNYRYHGKWNIL